MSLIEVKHFFRKYGREADVVELDQSSATVDLAAKALNVMPGRIAKTLAVWAKDQPILLVIAGDYKLSTQTSHTQKPHKTLLILSYKI